VETEYLDEEQVIALYNKVRTGKRTWPTGIWTSPAALQYAVTVFDYWIHNVMGWKAWPDARGKVTPALLEEHRLTGKIFDAIRDLLIEKRLLLKAGTIVDATIVAAPSSTKNATKSRDPEMKQTRKGNAWHFGMKLHVGTDRKGRVHSVTGTHAATADITEMPNLLHGDERVVYGDQAYWKEADRQGFEARGVRYRVNRRPRSKGDLSERWRAINRARSRTRARGEHAFHVVKRLWGFVCVWAGAVRWRCAASFATRSDLPNRGALRRAFEIHRDTRRRQE